MDQSRAFEAERRRLLRLATRVLGDHAEAEDVVQAAWLRLDRTQTRIDDLPAWLTTVTTRLCLDRLRARTPVPIDPSEITEAEARDPAEDVVLADTVGVALQAVLDRLSPAERVAFVLHDSFGIDFPTIGAILDRQPAAARKLASRARARVAQPAAPEGRADWEVVDAFLAAARQGDFARLLTLLAPDVVVGADDAAIAEGTPERIEGREAVARMFNGGAAAALPVYVNQRPGAAWFHKGTARVAFDFTVAAGRIERIDFRAEPGVLAALRRRSGDASR